jgi:hypothetical protein
MVLFYQMGPSGRPAEGASLLSVTCLPTASPLQLLLAAAAVTAVFLVVPRTVSMGTITVHSTKMTFNDSTHTYRILLVADIPFQNANYAKVGIEGRIWAGRAMQEMYRAGNECQGERLRNRFWVSFQYSPLSSVALL